VSKTSDQLIVFGVRSNPEPDDRVAIDECEGTVSESDASSIDRLSRVHLLETEARVVRIDSEAPIGFTGATLDGLG